MIVLKFGGTSVQDGAAMRRSVDIVADQKERRPLVVLSAIGGATNAFLRLGQTALTGDTRAAQEILADLISRHRWILFDLDLEPESEREVADTIGRCGEELNDFIRGVVLLRELTPRIQDAIAGYGERLSTLLFSARAQRVGVDAALVDARDIVVTDDKYTKARPNRSVLESRAKDELLPLLRAGRVPITQGFVGSTEKRRTDDFGTWRIRLHGLFIGSRSRCRRGSDLDGRGRYAHGRQPYRAGVYEGPRDIFRRGGRIGLFRGQSSSSIHDRACSELGHSRPHLEFPASRRERHENHREPEQNRVPGKIHRRQEGNHHRSRSITSDVDGPWIPAFHVRGFRPARSLGRISSRRRKSVFL